MKIFGKMQNEFQEKRTTIVTLIAVIGILGATILILLMLLFKTHNERYMQFNIPPLLSGQTTLTLGVNSASKETFGVFAQYFASIVGNFSYKNAEESAKQLVRFFLYDIQHEESTRLRKTISFVEKNLISQTFIPQSTEINYLTKSNRQYAKVEVKGLLSRSTGKTSKIVNFPYIYEFTLTVNNGNIYIAKSILGKFEAKTIAERQILKEYKNNNEYLDFTTENIEKNQMNKKAKK